MMALIFNYLMQIPVHHSVINHRNHDQCKDGRYQQTKDQRYSQSTKDGVIDDEETADHRRDTGQHDRLGANRCRIDHRLLKLHTFAYLLVNKIDQQDGVAHDDACKRDHADHRCRGKLCIEQGMPGHDADDGQRDRRHDYQRNFVGMKLRHYQQIDH